MNWLDFLVCCFATYRLSLMMSKESGPMRIFRRLRNLPPPKSSAREGLSCQWCLSVWIAVPVVLLRELTGGQVVTLSILILAVSGSAICINQTFTKG